MRTLWEDMLLALIMGMILPGIILSGAVWFLDRQPEAVPVLVEPSVEEFQVEAMGELDAYLVGVVLAEMPASFEEEALKAQAVVARTYTKRAEVTGGKHGDGTVCTQASCCQAYLPEAEYLERGGTQESVDKVRAAVLATSGQVLLYEGQLIEATYFSCSGGQTEDAVAVWGTDFPYLRSVESPGEEGASVFTDQVTLTAGEFRQRLKETLEGEPSGWFGPVTYTAGGGVDTMFIGGKPYRGTELRTLLGLRSTAFQVTVEGELIRIQTRGYGHRVGMSQYGAEAMAVAGSTYPEILAHYYQGTELWTLPEE